ncbi:1-(5-phosphoribosyl)-5-[(5-phosphoribosylamino)methylideneamino]imidazole-4-carboxamide isomerase [Parabacteroides sp. 52]|uniref:1-(5-phosphoribosyl)-5-[(5- phosphoribosylamino)methylideneamino]imidazole-4- carboxamide isomerase n=1 Tax=Parabacteroides sp. 52 TaxID=2302940 RepID=UPI0013D49C49|nr:1-(5-phosphoribosyl)-5-[(5-phosphoribosylamino)methylideneamino]imidazole-4-carboxamide isomerase [Parabacteroides sp. 52]NDV55218.1 1-(5-phosphoribosyl)-5-[(5-phosphoribosylamino)methylideneamino]imidazole-4-carboxamide isomerase [Parabacteroides sp. 52]
MIELIPAIDIIEGKCVRLTQGDYDTKKVYNEDPLEVAKMFEDHGIRRLHVVDLDGARKGRIINYRILERLASHTDLVIDFGGGLKQDQDLQIAFESGAQMVTGGSIAVKNPDVFLSWIEKYGSQRIILGADAKDKKIAISGWEETTEKELIPFIADYHQAGIQKVICTDISRDGMLEGPAVALYKEIHEAVPVYLIASGGVGSVEDIEKLEEAQVPAVIFGKAIYEGRIQLKDLRPFINY